MSQDSVQYRDVDAHYFKKRALKPYAKVFHLWALGVGAVISGDFFGWNFGLAAGGFAGLFIAMLLITVLYLGLCYSIAEMSSALPHTGGAYSFARSALGPWGGYITGLAENMEYILTPATIVVGVGSYLGAIFETPASVLPLWWALSYAVFVALNIWGVKLSFRFSVVITALAIAILVVFYVSAAHLLNWRHAFTVDEATQAVVWFPRGWMGILAALPYAIWFYLGIEELPLAAEESMDPRRDIPRGIIAGLLTLIVFSFLTLIFSSMIPPGVTALSASQEPLLDGFKAIFGAGLGAKALALLAVTGLVASFHTIIFAYGRQIYSLSRAGYFPPFFSLTHGKHQTPHTALIAGAGIGYAVALTIHQFGPQSPLGAMLLNMAVFGAVISYALQMLSFLMLRRRFPKLERPYVSRFGVPGAVVALALSLLSLVGLFVSDPIYQKVVLGAAVWFALGLLYFIFFGRFRLIRSPEEDFALRANKSDIIK